MSALRTLTFLALIAGVCSSQPSDCSYVGLLNHLNLTTTNDVLAVTRPVKNCTTPTLVQLDMVLFGILEVDEKSQTITTHVQIQMHWKNEFLTWNSSNFCGIKMLTVPKQRLWIPDVTIQEDVSDTGSAQDSPLLSLYFSGSVVVNGRQRLTSTCQLNLFLFPFDRQQCNITFSSMNYDGETIQLGTINSDTDITFYSEKFMITQGEWLLENIAITVYTVKKNGSSYNKLIYTVQILRKPMLYVINFIVPLFFFLVLDLASFFISEARGEKLSFKVTVLLSISVLLLILKDMLPSTEDKLPLIASYCVAVFTLVGISVLEAMLVSFLVDLDGYCGKKEVQSCDNTPVEIQLEAKNHKDPAGDEGEVWVNPANSRPPSDWPSDHDLLKLLLDEVKAARQEAGRRDKDERKAGRYKRLAEITDIVFFVIYFLAVVIFLACMYKMWFQD